MNRLCVVYEREKTRLVNTMPNTNTICIYEQYIRDRDKKKRKSNREREEEKENNTRYDPYYRVTMLQDLLCWQRRARANDMPTFVRLPVRHHATVVRTLEHVSHTNTELVVRVASVHLRQHTERPLCLHDLGLRYAVEETAAAGAAGNSSKLLVRWMYAARRGHCDAQIIRVTDTVAAAVRGIVCVSTRSILHRFHDSVGFLNRLVVQTVHL